jgi:multiple sugar transport system substrate-binding protein
MEQHRARACLIDEFEAANPDIQIEIISTPFGVFQERLFVSLRSGDAPDVGYVGARWLQELRENEFLSDMSDIMAGLPREDWIEGTFVGAETADGLYAIADRVDPWVIYYNERLFAEAGIEACPETTEDFIAAGQALTRDGVAGFGLVGAKHATQLMQFANFLWAHGGHFVSEDGNSSVFDSPNAIAALEFYADLYKVHGITQRSAVSDSRNEVRQLFFTEQLAMFVDGPWAQGTIDETAPNIDWGVCKIPQVPGMDRNSVLSAWYYTIFSTTDHPEEAARFVEFMLQPEHMARGVVTLPARFRAQEMERFQTERWAPFIDAAQYGAPELGSRVYSEIADIVGDAIQEVLLNVKTAEQAARDASNRIDQALR